MKQPYRISLPVIFIALSNFVFASNIADVVKAQAMLNQALSVLAQFNTVQLANVPAPQPLNNNNGRYLLPYTKDGALTDWANKALNSQIGAAVGEKVGEEAGKQLASRVPFGGFASGFMKKKGKEIGAVAALGGTDFLKKTSSLSFNDLNEYIVYLHVQHSADPGYPQALAAAMAVYPDMAKNYDNALKAAFGAAQAAQ